MQRIQVERAFLEKNGIVSSVRIFGSSSEPSYVILTGEGAVSASPPVSLSIYEKVSINGESIAGTGEHATKEEYEALMNSLLKKSDPAQRLRTLESRERGKGRDISWLLPKLQIAANKIVRSYIAGAPMLVRFHNDGDGAAAGISLYRACKQMEAIGLCAARAASWQMNKGISYTHDSFFADKMIFDSHKSSEQPLLVLNDFGSVAESNRPIEAALKLASIIWIDHHTLPDGFVVDERVAYINPTTCGKTSAFTAGYTASILAEALGASSEAVGEAALISDYSPYSNFSDANATRIAQILDYLTSLNSPSRCKPRQIDAILNDPAESERIYGHAKSLMDGAVKDGMKLMGRHRTAGGIDVYVVDFSLLGIRSGYPISGRYCSKLHNTIETANNGHTITIVHNGSYISLRVSADIKESVDLLGVIDKICKLSGGLLSGGGHKEAASVKSNMDNQRALSLLLNELGIGAAE